ncbi:YaeQ family protein [Pseudofulvimonas gallinarii]|uniref:Uncharacterized protein YaeQ n=1 Tax=Pseudofulvimonas gallinarii TaxID=634155 RepID=A0A4V3UU10_9GAMM|nr:YaeQ family protein [Pseudofulvimonas gallinarii]TCT01453.1 uncharacterized protein YaeQ [Pseudofulvimonas gallinarii]THD12711.1 hypothetical protein B1808_11690 [Pseudofulvimonas gallinarii]
MTPSSTIYKVELQVTDMDRHYYAVHVLTLAQHPSETPARLMTRLVAFALFADERLEFGRGLSNEEDADLWQRDYTDHIERWIFVGQPDEGRIRKASVRSGQVIVVNYGGHSADVWWSRIESSLARFRNLTVIDLSPDDVEAATGLLQRGMRLTAMIQDGELQLMSDQANVAMTPRYRLRSDG